MLVDMLRGYVLDFLGSWGRYISFMEFAYNNSYQTSIGMAPMAGNVELLYAGQT